MAIISGGNIIGNLREPITVRLALGTVATGGGVLAWQNPHDSAIIITRLVLDVTTKTTAACTVDAGSAANGTTSSDNLINGLDIGTAIGTFDNVSDGGTNGKARQKLAAKGGAADYLTVSQASGAIAGLVGYAYVTYIIL